MNEIMRKGQDVEGRWCLLNWISCLDILGIDRTPRISVFKANKACRREALALLGLTTVQLASVIVLLTVAWCSDISMWWVLISLLWKTLFAGYIYQIIVFNSRVVNISQAMQDFFASQLGHSQGELIQETNWSKSCPPPHSHCLFSSCYWRGEWWARVSMAI